MDLIRAFLRQYWLNVLAFVIFVAAAVRFYFLDDWIENAELIGSAIFGFAAFVASEEVEVAVITGHYGWTRQQWWQHPASFVRFTGGVALVVATVLLYWR